VITLNKAQRDTFANRYNLRKYLEPNQMRYSDLTKDLQSALLKNLRVKKLSETYLVNILHQALSEDERLIKYIQNQKPLPPPDDIEGIVFSVAYLVWELYNQGGSCSE
jgi:hypothetical protein